MDMNTPHLTQSLSLRAQQQLVMTPQLQAAIKLLQMNNLELDAYLDEQIELNPLLEKQEPERTDVSVEDMAAQESDSGSTEDEFSNTWEDTGDVPEAPPLPAQDFDAGTARVGAGGSLSFDDPDRPFDANLTQAKTLRDHLYDQMKQSFSAPADWGIGALLIDRLDEAGYLRIDIDAFAQTLGADLPRVQNVLEHMRGFDPAGIFARDLPDCLRLQLQDRGMLDAPFEKLLNNLALIAAHEHKKLAQVCGVNETYLRDMLDVLKTLNPKPAGAFSALVVQTAIPDVLMKTLPKHVGGGWRVELNPETLPRVLINQTYYNDVCTRAKSAQDKAYLTSQMSDATFLVRALDQRAQTILKVASEIIERQNAFFLYGIEYLTPMTLKDIAQAIDMHESTISRVTTGKFMGTPRGIFEMKFFFTAGLAGEGGVMHSAESIRARIKTMIEGEAPNAILSDEAIAEILQKDGVDIARRTVAKYREGMNIPTSSIRRKMKRNG